MWRIPNTVREIEPPQADMTAKRILAAGRLTPQKGFDMLIHAFAPVAAKHPDWELRICGARPEPARGCRRASTTWGWATRITLAGPSEDIPGEMAQASVYVLSSRFEGFPLVLIEAMAKGMAAVAFDCPTGPSDMIEDHQNGILVPALDVEGLSRGMLEFVEDEELRRRCGAAAVDGARALHDGLRRPAVGRDAARARAGAPAGVRRLTNRASNRLQGCSLHRCAD